MTTVSTAWTAIKARIAGNTPPGLSVLRWMNEDSAALPNTPAAFLYTELQTEQQFLAGFGGGSGANLWRTPARIEAYVFVPRGDGVAVATDLAEAIAALFRGYRTTDIQCFDAAVHPLGDGANLKPPGLDSAVDNYFCALCEVNLHIDQVG